MGVLEAAMWGLAGGLAAQLLSLVTAVTAAGFTWPWQGHREQIGPRLFVFVAGLILGALVAAATHNSMNAPWPAFIMGVGAPATIRGVLSGVTVSERKPEPTAKTLRVAEAEQEV
ncbi:hypothetical protein DEF23_17730 [Marinitenerispora sediminis]|uniref:Uncharacterized protein n=1 Tax=Marinitenerispora sediminis TaxID=1931232 RepID=A0A368T3X1_9ACTN|nr:hypothetical protein DEF28_20140 [Marinitenerispora sediminis]RCV53349.1 hypothetical protein DEF23_17730 [Marinitenerispora sediminis]RCV57571.1 hypothetical protein DEF24_15050 [Marinitenerispora sediminis]